MLPYLINYMFQIKLRNVPGKVKLSLCARYEGKQDEERFSPIHS
jgi:hypothetical protein